MNKRQKMYERIEKHGNDLNRIFDTGLDPIELCKKLRRIEGKAHQLATDSCNYPDVDPDDILHERCLNQVDKLLHFREKGIPVFINYDARGYALKIKDDYVREHNLKIDQDWGGYGLIAPDLS